MTDDEIKKLAREVVNETLHRMGLDPEDPDTVTDLPRTQGPAGRVAERQTNRRADHHPRRHNRAAIGAGRWCVYAVRGQ